MLNVNSCSTDQYTIPPLLRFDGVIKKQMIATVKRSDISTRAKKCKEKDMKKNLLLKRILSSVLAIVNYLKLQRHRIRPKGVSPMGHYVLDAF